MAPGSRHGRGRPSCRGSRTGRSSAVDRCAIRSSTARRRIRCSHRTGRPSRPVGRSRPRSSSQTAGSCDARTRTLSHSRSPAVRNGLDPCSGKSVDRIRNSTSTSYPQTRGRRRRRIRTMDRGCNQHRNRNPRHYRSYHCKPNHDNQCPASQTSRRCSPQARQVATQAGRRHGRNFASLKILGARRGARRERRSGRMKSDAPPGLPRCAACTMWPCRAGYHRRAVCRPMRKTGIIRPLCGENRWPLKRPVHRPAALPISAAGSCRRGSSLDSCCGSSNRQDSSDPGAKTGRY